MEIEIYTDGGCIGNGKNPKAPGGLGVAIYIDKQIIVQHSRQLFDSPNTNQKAELHAVIDALTILNGELRPQYIKNDFVSTTVILYSDSAYMINGITDWINTWRANGWLNAKREPVANQELWIALDNCVEALQKHNIIIKWTKVKGHSGNTGNEFVDILAKNAMQAREVHDVFNYNSQL